jgi:uncharacterized SAM-binding protein YcdF (DUF218 family)
MAGRRWKKWPLWLLVVLAVYVAAAYRAIVVHSRGETLAKTGVIVVFGAAEYDGRPSPVYKARLDHAAQLYRLGLAPVVITTGGGGGDPRYTEGEVGRAYLASLGIPDRSLIAETQSPDTAESARRVARIMRANGMTTCLAVSDGYHMFRIERMLGREGISVLPAPRPNSWPSSFWKRQASVGHEIVSYTLWWLRLS